MIATGISERFKRAGLRGLAFRASRKFLSSKVCGATLFSPASMVLIFASFLMVRELRYAYLLKVARDNPILVSLDLAAESSSESTTILAVRSLRNPSDGGLLQGLLKIKPGQMLILDDGTSFKRELNFDGEATSGGWFSFWVQLANHQSGEPNEPSLQVLKVSLSRVGVETQSEVGAMRPSNRMEISEAIIVSRSDPPLEPNPGSVLRRLGILPAKAVVDLYLDDLTNWE